VNEALRLEVVKRRESQEEAEDANRQLTAALARLRDTQRTIVRDERLRAIGRLASGVAHNINNNLQVITGHCDILMGTSDGETERARVGEHLERIRLAASDGAEIVRRLRQFYGHREDRKLRAVDVNTVLEEVITLAEPRWKDQAQAQRVVISVERNLEPVPHILGERSTLREAFLNLLFNAVDAIHECGTIRVSTRSDGDKVEICVSDDGVGMSGEERDRCLEPFFSTKVVHGSGLGLPLVHGVVHDHGGALEIESELEQGTTVRIALPVALEGRIEPAVVEEAPAPRPLSILLVDDDEFVLEVLQLLLVRDGHRVATVGDGAAALELCATERFDLIITDMAMPGMSGDRLAGQLRREGVEAPVILLTGFGDRLKTSGERPPNIDLVVSKPIGPKELRQAVMSVRRG
jgi:signal transduction histidine kinase/CheY-like chemotaxis protein